MADFVKGLFGRAGVAVSSAGQAADTDFADFVDYATAASPSAPSHAASSAVGSSAIPASPTGSFGPGMGLAGRPYTKWYRVWERAHWTDFYAEMFILPVIVFMIFVHVWGTSSNKRKVRGWIGAHAETLQQEFSSVGFRGGKNSTATNEAQDQAGELVNPEDLLKKKKADEYVTYATGRQNVAFVDIRLSLLKRYNPMLLLGENILGFLFEGLPAPEERMEATAYAFDGREKDLVTPQALGGAKVANSEYDGFVWAVVHKDLMKRLRNDRYDISLTVTKDHPKLPVWATVMSEAAEVTDTLLTPDLVSAIEQSGEEFEALIISDQPTDQPKKLDETIPRKRVSLSLKLPSGTSPEAFKPSKPIFDYFLRLTDQLVKDAHWRPEVMRRIKQTREDEIKKIKKVEEDEKAEQYKTTQDKKKKDERDAKLKGLSADQQRKFLEKERERDSKKQQKRRTVKS